MYKCRVKQDLAIQRLHCEEMHLVLPESHLFVFFLIQINIYPGAPNLAELRSLNGALKPYL